MRYADDSNIFVKSEMAADRVMKSVTSWLERKLFLKVSASKTKVVRPTKSKFLGFTFWKNGDKWKCKPTNERKAKLFNEEDIYKVANSRLGWYKRCAMDVVNFILNPKILKLKTKERPGLVNPLEYYLNSL